MSISRVGVVGCGLMGSGIAEVSARAGVDVVVYEVNDEACDRGRQRISASVERAVKAGKLDAETRDEMLARISITTDFADFADRELVIEAIAENEEVKLQVFATLDAVVTSRDAILASNTSSIPIMKLAMATSRPEHVVGLHFFNPVPVLNLVELVPSLLTSPTTAQAARAFASEQLNKLVIDAQDRAGFIVNALLVPYLLWAPWRCLISLVSTPYSRLRIRSMKNSVKMPLHRRPCCFVWLKPACWVESQGEVSTPTRHAERYDSTGSIRELGLKITQATEG